jgi:hypothetical protein
MRRGIGIVVGAMVVAAASVGWQAATHGLQGVVTDAGDKRVAGAWIEVRKAAKGAIDAAEFEGPAFRSMRSDADGRWSFADLGDGTWVVTAVASAEPRTDEELQQLARPQAGGRTPAGVAVSRLLRRFDAGAPKTERVNIGLATGATTDQPLAGQLVGAFEPDAFGYELRLTRVTMMSSGVATSSTVVSTVDAAKSTPVFSAVPDREGRFDFGPLPVQDFDTLAVEAVPLDGGETGTAFSGMVAMLGPRSGMVAIPLRGQRTISLEAVADDGTPVPLQRGEQITFDLWADDGSSNAWMEESAAKEQVLAEGTYLARATLGEFASAVTPFKVEAKGGATDVPLRLQPCSPYTVHLVDDKGAPLPKFFLKLGPEAAKDFPKPCRITARCEGGDVRLEGVLPGAYEVEFKALGKDAFTRRLELKADGAPIAVTLP